MVPLEFPFMYQSIQNFKVPPPPQFNTLGIRPFECPVAQMPQLSGHMGKISWGKEQKLPLNSFLTYGVTLLALILPLM